MKQGKYLHHSQINEIVKELDEFSIKFVKKNGEIVSGERCTCTSWHSAGFTLNLKFLNSGEFRTVRRISIIEFNGVEVVL